MNHPAPPLAPAPDRPLVLSVLLGVSGWAAGVFILFFVALLFRPASAGEAAVCGAVLLAAAWGLFKADGRGEWIFVAQLALALSIAGQCLVLYAMSKDARGIAPIAGAAWLLQATLAVAMPNPLHRALSTFFATIAWALLLRFTLFGENRGWREGSALQAASLPAALAGWALTWGPVAAALAWAVRSEPAWRARRWAPAARPVVAGLITGLAWATFASSPFEWGLVFGGPGKGTAHLALWPVLSALAALGALACAFALRRRALMGGCAAAALLHAVHFYHALGTTLLAKSLLMLAMGAIFLAGAHGLRSKEAA